MPGALYDRTSSLEPTPEPDFERTRVVRFASEVSVSPSRRLSETPRPAHQIEEMEAGPSSGRRQSSNPEQRAQDLFPAEESSENEEGPSSSPTKRPSRGMGRFVQEAVRQRSADKNPDVSLLLPQSPAPATWSSPNKGKGKAPVLPEAEVINVDDSEEESSSEDEHNRSSRADISVTTRVKGKERELHTARRQERESRSLANDDERTRDKERIRILEEELRKLREELARRPVVTQSNIAPPPPPPPPPPVFSRPQTMNQQEQTFADVRASLRHAGTPVEKPINPAAYGGPSVRKGQPTIVGADMMAAFLTEMKTH
ncbi:uncharacterized protein FOMMEDRAFT_17137, partial [Fomitiporia mediterranea MF3/22]|uniref:uncharacterized protein n=1 Tax=Fomitiporia mediterranea (strain MF3/22) TaxID=694068 RepID=UPI00044078B1